MKTKSISLDEYSLKALENIISINNCSVSEAICVALITFEKEHLEFKTDVKILDKIKKLLSSKNQTLEDWCNKYAIKKETVAYVCSSLDQGKKIIGYGNYKNKWRDKNDERFYKTQTAYVAMLIEKEFGIEQ